MQRLFTSKRLLNKTKKKYSNVIKPIINNSNNFDKQDQEQYNLIENNYDTSIIIYDDNVICITKTPIHSFDLTNETHLKILEILSDLKYISCFPLSKSRKIYNSHNLEQNILSENNLEKNIKINDIEKTIKCENIKSFIMSCENKEHV
jgi:hypothetical protein